MLNPRYAKKVLIPHSEIIGRIAALAKKVDADYKRVENPVLLVVMKGAFRVASDFLEYSNIDWQVELIQLSSYQGTKSSGAIEIGYSSLKNFEGRNVLVVEDIVDTGLSLRELLKHLKGLGVKQLKTLSLLTKPDALIHEVQLNYLGFNIGDAFVVGYGLDLDQYGRALNDIYELKMNPMINLVLFGPPGAGKGTQSTFLVEKYGLIHLSTGDLLRGEIAAGTDLGKAAKDIMDRGELVSDEIVIGMIRSKLEQNPGAKGFIFDGFPRTSAQAEALHELLAEYDTSITAMLSLEVPKEELVKRLLERGKSSGRADDQNEEVIENRIKEYNKKTAILKEFYTKKNKCVEIEGVGSVEEITQRLSEAIDQKA